jgi:hypothetical protein
MAANFTAFHQVERPATLVFEEELKTLVEVLRRPSPEYQGAQIRDNSSELSWLVVATLRGSMVPPRTPTITFEVVEGTWADGLARAMQESIARLTEFHRDDLAGTTFHWYGRRDSAGLPTAVPRHPRLRGYIQDMEHMLFSTQQDLDWVRTKDGFTQALLAETKDTVRILAKERASLRCQRDKMSATISKLRNKTKELEKTVEDLEGFIGEMEEEGEDLRKEMNAYLSDDDDFQEEMDMEDEDDEDELVNEEEDPEEVVPEEEEEDPEEVIYEEEDPEERTVELSAADLQFPHTPEVLQ